MRRSQRMFWLLALLLAPSLAHAAPLRVFQIQGDALGALPVGRYAGHDTEASDIYGGGSGFSATVSVGITPHLNIAMRSSWMRNRKTSTSAFAASTQRASIGPLSAHAQIFEAVFQRTLKTVPTDLIVQYRVRPRGPLGFYGEAGLGLMAFTRDERVETTLGNITNRTDRQTSLSGLLGAGISLGLGRRFELVAGADLHEALTQDGDVWWKRDNPKFLVGSMGLRFPRD